MLQWQQNEGCNNYCESSSTSCICCPLHVYDLLLPSIKTIKFSSRHLGYTTRMSMLSPHQKNILSRLTLLCERKNSLTLKIKYVFLYSWKYGWLEIKKVLNSCENKHKNGWEGSGIFTGYCFVYLDQLSGPRHTHISYLESQNHANLFCINLIAYTNLCELVAETEITFSCIKVNRC